VRTFPKELAEFRRVVEARGAELRLLSSEELLAAQSRPTEHLSVQGRPATIATIVRRKADGSLRVVLQGFMPGRLFRLMTSVALDGFYKRSDGSVEAMRDEEFHEFD